MALDTGREDWTGTPWHSTDVPFMWSTVAHHSPDAYAAHLSGWHRTTELLSEHVSRMRAYRDNLALAWNPTRSPAAAVYLARFDTDIANAQATLDASIANYAAYTAALNIVSEAQTALRPIAEEYSANATSETSRQEMVSASGGRAAAAAFTAAPDTRGRQAELTGMARSVMYRASQELIEQPPPSKSPRNIRFGLQSSHSPTRVSHHPQYRRSCPSNRLHSHNSTVI